MHQNQSKYLSLNEAVQILMTDGIVALPTETVYGLAGLATSQTAVNKIYKAKNRPADNPLICHFHSLQQILDYVTEIPLYLPALIDAFSPGPVSYLLNLPKNSPLKAAVGEQTAVACRIPDNQTTLQIIRSLNLPVAAPSANTSTKTSGVCAQMIVEDLGDRIEGIVDGGICKVGLESTILDCRKSDEIRILRPGIIGKKELEIELRRNNCANITVYDFVGNVTKPNLTVPGSKYKHYSPDTQLILIPKTSERDKIVARILNTDCADDICLIGLEEDLQSLEVNGAKTLSLGSEVDMESIAANLYHNLYKLDRIGVLRGYWIEFDISDNSVGQALKDRLSKVLLQSV